jgi:hypothetical protein
MQCAACGDDHDRTLFPAPRAIVPLCGTCLGKLVKAETVTCQSCGGRAVISRGNVCIGCATDRRKVKGESHATDCKAIQDQPDGR